MQRIQRRKWQYSDVQEEKLYSTGDSDLDNLLEKAFCEGYEYAQKEFNSKAQKAMRRKWDLEQAMDAYDSDQENGIKIQKAKSQDSMLGRKRTNELIDKATKQTKTEPEKFLGITVGKKAVLKGKDNKELEEMENATELLRAGRKRSKDTHGWYTVRGKRDESFEKELDRKITNNDATGSTFGRNTLGAHKNRNNDWEFDNQLKEQIKDRKKRMFKEESAKKVKDFVKNNKKGLAIGGTLGTAALVGGIALHRRNKKKKEEEEKNKKSK